MKVPWTNIDDKLPPIGEYVLVLTDDKLYHVAVFDGEHMLFYDYMTEKYDVAMRWKVTHWRTFWRHDMETLNETS